MITNVELINFSVGNAYCLEHEEYFQFHTFFSKLNTQRAVAVAIVYIAQEGPNAS